MRKPGFAVSGSVTGVGLAGLFAWRRSGMAGAGDPQGMNRLGVLFLALPLGALARVVFGLILKPLVR